MPDLLRILRAAAAGACLVILGTHAAFAQSTLSEAQKQALQSVYGSTGETVDHLQGLQDARVSAALSPLEFSRDPMVEALAAAAAPADRMLFVLELCHKLALDLTAVDHTTSLKNDPRTVDQYGEEFGPARSSWALAIVHLAIYEAVSTIVPTSASYTAPGDGEPLRDKIIRESGLNPAAITNGTGTVEAAIFYAAYGTLIHLYPEKVAHIEARSNEILVQLRGDGVGLGKAVGQAAALVTLRSRGWSLGTGFTDGSELPEPLASDYASPDVRKWHADPITKLPLALGGHWSHVRPFVLAKPEQFRPDAPPAFGSADFIDAYKMVKAVGGDSSIVEPDLENGRWFTATQRTGDTEGVIPYAMNQTFQGIYWGYDGTAQLCAPPRLYNSIAMTIAREKLHYTNVHQFARLLALVNVAMADAGISAWEAKYYYLYPRPITYIRGADADGTPEGRADPHWTPLGAPVTNGEASGRNLTPPFPAYPSGHAVFGGAVFQVLRNLYSEAGVADDKFTFLSDEYNGLNYSPGKDTARLEVPVDFDNLGQAEDQNGESRIYLGIHWEFDKVAGIHQGNMVGNFVFNHILAPM